MPYSWKDIEEVFASSLPISQKYRYFYDTLHRVCIELTDKLPAEYSDFYSRLQAVCRLTNYPLSRIDSFRWEARQVNHFGLETDDASYKMDVRLFVDAMAHFTNSAVPATLLKELPQALSVQPRTIEQINYLKRKKRLRFYVEEVAEHYILAYSKDFPCEVPCKISYIDNAHTLRASQLLKPGMEFNALSCKVYEADVYHPLYIVINPDFLLDITAITGCLKSYGDSAFNHLLDKFLPQKSNVYTLLGDFANQFLDDAFNTDAPDYNTSMKKVFTDRLISICACDEINGEFFTNTKIQFDNILQVVEGIKRMPEMQGDCNVQLEPSFFCEALGVQGRMDCLIDLDNDGRRLLIELKSGKYDEYRNRAKIEHLMQMLLYKEILYYNCGVKQNDVTGDLLYSKYPKLIEQRSFQEIIFKAMDIRNNIVCMEMGLVDGNGREWLSRITPEALRRAPSCNDKFWLQYCLPVIKPITDAIASMDDLTADYFYTFLQFIEREQYESKVCVSRPDTTRTMSSLWNADVNTKAENGDIYMNLEIVNLRLKNGVEALQLGVHHSSSDAEESNEADAVLPNFRIGDSVILYKRNDVKDNATTQQVIRCNVENYEGETIWLKLKQAQSNVGLFKNDSLYAIEHDYVESSYRSLYSGLFSLVTAEKRRRDLLLSQRIPETDESLSLSHNYLNEQIDNIVLRAKQAKDMFLLMGPPGTGKTSVALRSMVEEFLASGDEILLLSYTNRAVDEICEMLSTIDPQPDYIRLGRELTCDERFAAHLLNNVLGTNVNRSDVTKLIANTHIFVSTVSSLSGNLSFLDLKKFSVAIFDEASQIIEPQAMPILTSSAIGKFIMIGDHKQLPAVVVQDEGKSAVTSELLRSIGLTNCRNSLFERLYEQNASNSTVVAMLNHQGRMHPAISQFASLYFYDDRLVPVGVPHQKEALPSMVYSEGNHLEYLLATKRCAFIDVPLPKIEERQQKANDLEAKKIAMLVDAAIRLHKTNGIDFNPARQIGVIVPFRRQITLVRKEIETITNEPCNIVIDTVERYQGSQRDIIIYGTTITRRYELDTLSTLIEIASVPIDRKLNVAITRARKQLFILGNKNLLSSNQLYKQLIDYCDSCE